MDWRSSLFIAVILKGLQCSTAQYYIDIPKKLWAVKHSCVVIPCTYNYDVPKLPSGDILGIWFDAIDTSTPDKVFMKSKTPENHASFIGQLGDGNCSIKIHKVQPKDTKIYKFRVEMKHFRFSFMDIVQLTVLDSPPDPTLVYPNQLIPEATHVTLNCSTIYTCSEDVVDLLWTPNEGTITVARTYTGEGVWKVQSKKVFQISRNHNGMPISCQASYSSGVKSQVIRGSLHIRYKPEILQKFQCKRNRSAIHCECAAIANPPANITWCSNGVNVTETFGFSISSSSNGSKTMSTLEGSAMPPGTVWCTASNMEGSVSHELPVYANPQILQESFCKKNLNGIYCECAAIANPPANITWRSNDTNVTETSGFSINSSSNGSKTKSRLEGAVTPPGGLWCIASNTMGSEAHNLSIHEDWTKLILICGGIVAFLILCTIGAVFAIRKCRTKKKESSRPNNYVMVTTKGCSEVPDKDRTRGHHGATSSEDVYEEAPEDSGNIYMNSDYQNENNEGDEDNIYSNVKNKKKVEEEEDYEESDYINC